MYVVWCNVDVTKSCSSKYEEEVEEEEEKAEDEEEDDRPSQNSEEEEYVGNEEDIVPPFKKKITRKLQHLQMTPLMERTTVLHPAVMKQRKKGRLSVVFRQGGTWEGSAKLKLQRLTVGCRLILPMKPEKPEKQSCNRCLKLSKTVKRRRVQLWRVF
uniref:Uncharacterized protein n=1 Tax=Knipowitschia caucasica TaxID=637954 RepID=A0AAV2JIQ6_KNICA